jgi:hypothetical protein
VNYLYNWLGYRRNVESKDFNESFNYWLAIAQKYTSKENVDAIRSVAQNSFSSKKNELTLDACVGLNERTIVCAKINYQTAFVVATGSDEQILTYWHNNSDHVHRGALLLSLISASYIGVDRLCKFLSSTDIQADNGWFIFKKQATEAYHAFEQCRGSTPSEFYQENRHLLSLQTSVSREMETIYVPFYISEALIERHLHPTSFNLLPEMPSKGDGRLTCPAINEIIAQTKIKKIENVALTYDKAVKIIDDHSWYRVATCALVVKMRVPKDQLSESANILTLNVSDQLKMNFRKVEKIYCKGVYPLRILPAHISVVNNCDEIPNNKDGGNVYFYQRSDEKVFRAVIKYHNNEIEELNPNELDLIPMCQKKLNEGSFDKNLVGGMYQAKRYNSVMLSALHLHLCALKENLKSRDNEGFDRNFEEIANLIEIESSEKNEKLLQQMKAMTMLDRASLMNENFTLLSQGRLDEDSSLYGFPIEILAMVAAVGIEMKLKLLFNK